MALRSASCFSFLKTNSIRADSCSARAFSWMEADKSVGRTTFLSRTSSTTIPRDPNRSFNSLLSLFWISDRPAVYNALASDSEVSPRIEELASGITSFWTKLGPTDSYNLRASCGSRRTRTAVSSSTVSPSLVGTKFDCSRSSVLVDKYSILETNGVRKCRPGSYRSMLPKVLAMPICPTSTVQAQFRASTKVARAPAKYFPEGKRSFQNPIANALLTLENEGLLRLLVFCCCCCCCCAPPCAKGTRR
mmetsp:Transcript_7010/g.14930  ORF Transcript_7010/g.14930 Transcript_7010/m.14930 type:complete len:248 (-) Transcript_7010:414-1157(-)